MKNRVVVVVAAIFLAVFAVVYGVLRFLGSSNPPVSAALTAPPPVPTVRDHHAPATATPETPPPPATDGAIARTPESAAAPPPDESPGPMAAAEPPQSAPPPTSPPVNAPPAAAPPPAALPSIAVARPPSAPPPSTNMSNEGSTAPTPEPAAPVLEAPPPAATATGTAATPPAATAPMLRSSTVGSKVISYFQRARTQIDTARAFGFVLMPRAAVTAEEKRAQKEFCEILLATLDFMTPGDAAARTEVLATYWPIVSLRESFEIKAAFAERNCDDLIGWYDHKVARSLASKAGVAGLSGPLLITWPSAGPDGEEARNPLIVDFSKADHERATKVLQYWFRQLKNRPELWTNRIREGTIRAELADAVNDTAGVVLAVLHGKWDSLNAVSATP